VPLFCRFHVAPFGLAGHGLSIVAFIVYGLLALLYLRRRSAIEPITAHAFSDVLAMLGATMLAK
jgi:membrane protease YdiL (CAAX protease family)